MTPIPRLRDYDGPAILSYGFRPFFLLGAIYSACAVFIWLAIFSGDAALPTEFAARDWHVHEMLFGYLAAVVTGFLLTAIPNWTGRLPLQGVPLFVLVAVWLAGRVAMAASSIIGWRAAALIDLLFLVMVAGAALREIIAGRNWRNAKVVVIICVLAIANAAFHAESHLAGVADYSARAGIAAVVTLIMLIGGRIVPSFTRNWLARENPGRLPEPFGRFDALAVLFSVGALALWVGMPDKRLTGVALGLAAVLQAWRLARWAGDRSLREPLLAILHIGFAFVPLGFGLLALSAFADVPRTVGIHAWTTGAFGTMTLAVMTRATLGHTGHELKASVATQFIYAAVIAAAIFRIWAGLQPGSALALLHIAGTAWVAAFAGFALVYGPLLCRPRALA
jgi:uncharacterized protein involved in response to NO